MGLESAPRALALDYNGTISDDEQLLEEIYLRVFAAAGAKLGSAAYRSRLLGLPDPELVREGLRLGEVPATDALCEAVLGSRLTAYAEAVAERPTISADACAFVRAAAGYVPLAVVSGAQRGEVEAGLRRAGLRSLFVTLVCIEDVPAGKPDPAGFALAVEHLRAHVPALVANQVLAVEDSRVGLESAYAAGLSTATVVENSGPADIVLEGLSEQSARALFHQPPTQPRSTP